MDERFDHVEGEMKAGFERVDGEMKAGFDRVDGEMKAGFEQVDGEIKELRAEIKSQGKELRMEMASMEARLRAQSSEHYVRTGEELGTLHSDQQQLLTEMQALRRTIVQIGWTGAITLIATAAGVLIAQLF